MGGSETRLTLARTAELDRSVFAEIIASLLQVISQTSHAPSAQVCHDFSGDFACIGHEDQDPVTAGSAPMVAWLRNTRVAW